MDVPTRETVSFLRSQLAAGASILEVGCGAGHVAAELLSHGCRVMGVDSDEEAVARARQHGITARRASWPDFDCKPVDAVAFTRSLHHIGPLPAAIRRARQLLRPGGVLLVEDIAFEDVDDATLRWFVDALRAHPARALLTQASGELVTKLLDSSDPAHAWHAHHDHDLHRAAAMIEALAAHFEVRQVEPVPYLYRYLVPVLPETPEGAAFVEDVLRAETRAGERGEATLVGRRIVGG